MSMIPGTYKLYKNENLEQFLFAVGVPYMARKMINIITPVMIFFVEGDTMTIKITSWLLSLESKFKLGEEYIEKMPNGTLKCVTLIINDNELLTNAVIQSSGHKTMRHLLFNEEEVVETLTHEKATGIGRRYYRRVQ